MSTFCPRTSSSVYPNNRSAAGLNASIRAVLIDHDDPVHGGVDDGAPPRFAGAQLVLELHALAEVVEHARELALAADHHLADREMERKHAPVPPSSRHFATFADDPGLAGREIPVEIPVVFLVIRRRHQHADVASNHLRFRIAEQPLGAAVEGLDPASGIDEDNPVDGRVDDGIEPFRACRRERRRGFAAVLRRVDSFNEPRDAEPGRHEQRQQDQIAGAADWQAVRRQKEVHRGQRRGGQEQRRHDVALDTARGPLRRG